MDQLLPPLAVMRSASPGNEASKYSRRPRVGGFARSTNRSVSFFVGICCSRGDRGVTLPRVLPRNFQGISPPYIDRRRRASSLQSQEFLAVERTVAKLSSNRLRIW